MRAMSSTSVQPHCIVTITHEALRAAPSPYIQPEAEVAASLQGLVEYQPLKVPAPLPLSAPLDAKVGGEFSDEDEELTTCRVGFE